MPALVAALGLRSEPTFPAIVLSDAEKAEGRRRLVQAGVMSGPIVGIFTGGRVSRLKRWPPENFIDLASALKTGCGNVALFVGPEEQALMPFFAQRLGSGIPVLFEPSVRGFAAMVAACALFVTGDSGPMHLACALRTRTVAIFQKADQRHWGPPPELARIVYRPGGATVEEVIEASLEEWKRVAGGASAAQRLA
jgi:heptosyltransferase-3